MVLELHNVAIGQRVKALSLTVESGELVTIPGPKGSGKTTLLRAVMGFIPVTEGHISIDGELLTPRSAPWFRSRMAYVPQYLSVPEGYNGVGEGRWLQMSADERYLWLLQKAVHSGKALLVVDEPAQPLSPEAQQTAESLLQEALNQGVTVLSAMRNE